MYLYIGYYILVCIYIMYYIFVYYVICLFCVLPILHRMVVLLAYCMYFCIVTTTYLSTYCVI